MSDSYYDVAQVCLNGHMVNDTWQSSPNFSKDICPKCGAKTIIECPACHKRIQGFYHVPGVITTRSASVRAYCHACGKPYPWTLATIDAAKALAEELDGLIVASQRSVTFTIGQGPRDPRAESGLLTPSCGVTRPRSHLPHSERR